MKNTFTKFLSIVLSVLMCMSTLAVGAFAADECTHANSTDYGVKEATCTEMGGHLYKCNDCGEEYATDVVPALGHDLSDKQTVPAACGQNEYTIGTCKRCGKEEKVEYPGTALTHEASTEVFTKLPDCEAGTEGYTYNKCIKCGIEMNKSNVVEGKHSYKLVEVTVLPTCGVKGNAVYMCVNEGCGYTVNVEIAALAHDVVDVAQVAPTCTAAGVAAHKKCERCGGLFKAALDSKGNLVATTAAELVIDPAHPESSCVVLGTVPGTCTTKAVTTYKCLKCAEEWTKEGEYGHDWKEHKTEANCFKYGYINYFCDLCGVKYHNDNDANDPMNEKITPPLGHTFKVDTDTPVAGPFDATCEESGYSVFHCTRCGNVKVDDAEKPALGHDMQLSAEEIAPECGVPGKTAVYTCANGCGKTLGGDPIDALDHEYADKVVPQTCLEDGYTIEACKHCGEVKAGATKKNIVKADGTSHQMAEKVIIAATCDKDGSLRHYCAICDGNDSLEVLPAIGHNFNTEADLVVLGTCQERGYAIYACMNGECDALTTVVGEYDYSAEGHERAMGGEGANPRVLREGTCTVKGLIKYTCTECNENYDKNTDYCTTSAHDRTEMPAVAPDCTTETNGYADDGIKCTKCDKWVVEPTVVKFEHTLDGKCDAQAETCDLDGWNEFTYCTVCEASGKADAKMCTAVLKVSTGIKIAKHGKTYTVDVAAQAATCDADGWNKFSYCSKCSTLDAGKAANKIAMLGHAWTTKDVLSAKAANGCVDYAFDGQVCANCNTLRTINYVEAEDHDWVKGAVVDPTCDEKGYTPYTCSKCGATEKRDYVDATGHKNAADEVFFGYCDDKVTDRKCVVCNAEIELKHTYENATVVDPTCDAPGYTIAICTRENCDSQVLKNYVAPTGHVKGAIIPGECVAPTYTAGGQNVYACANGCGYKFVEELAAISGVKVTIKADSGILAGADVVNGGLVNFVITLETANLKATSILAEIKYDSDVLTFVGADVEKVFGEKGDADVGCVVTDVTEIDTEGTLKIYSAADAFENVTINGEVLYATLTFRVDTNAVNTKTAITVLPLEILDSEEEFAATSDIATAEVETIKLGDVNGDGLINSIDAQLIRKLAAGVAIDDNTTIYLAAANVDGSEPEEDGNCITLNDFKRLSQYLVGILDYEELVLNK